MGTLLIPVLTSIIILRLAVICVISCSVCFVAVESSDSRGPSGLFLVVDLSAVVKDFFDL